MVMVIVCISNAGYIYIDKRSDETRNKEEWETEEEEEKRTLFVLILF